VKNGMKTKIFTGNGPDAVIKAVNDWLAAESGVTIRHTETREKTADGAPTIRFEIHYEQEASRS
jgi:hypothetical protein